VLSCVPVAFHRDETVHARGPQFGGQAGAAGAGAAGAGAGAAGSEGDGECSEGGGEAVEETKLSEWAATANQVRSPPHLHGTTRGHDACSLELYYSQAHQTVDVHRSCKGHFLSPCAKHRRCDSRTRDFCIAVRG
jgi:hypothetical protein